MDSIYLYATPALMALTIKAWLVINSDKRNLIVKNWPLALFFLSISIFNIIEVITYTTTAFVPFYSSFIKLYNGGLILAFSFLTIFAAKTSQIRLFTSGNFSVHYAFFSIVFFLLVINTNLFIVGYEAVGYGFVKKPGPYMEIGIIFCLINILASVSFLFWRFANKKINHLNRRRCKAILTSFLPFILTCLVFIGLEEFGIRISAAVLIPFTTTYLLLVLVMTESETGLFKLLSKTPFTKEYKTLQQVTRELQDFIIETSAGNNVSLKDLSSNIERQLVTHAIDCSQGNQSIAAKVLGISPSSLCRKK